MSGTAFIQLHTAASCNQIRSANAIPAWEACTCVTSVVLHALDHVWNSAVHHARDDSRLASQASCSCSSTQMRVHPLSALCTLSAVLAHNLNCHTERATMKPMAVDVSMCKSGIIGLIAPQPRVSASCLGKHADSDMSNAIVTNETKIYFCPSTASAQTL